MGPPVSQTDLLIIGAGPAGLMAAYWASVYGVKARIIDDKPTRVSKGHADGITCRTIEIFDSLDLAKYINDEAAPDFQMRYWRPNAHGRLERAQSLNSQSGTVSRFQQCLLSQGRIEELLDTRIHERGVFEIERNVETVKLITDDLNKGDVEYPIEVQIRHKSSGGGGGNETIRAKYLIGADGAHSWTRHQLGLEMKGDQTNHIWGVVDMAAETDFPDIRQSCVVCSEHGNIHMVPRECGLVRLYIQLDEYNVLAGSRAAATLDIILNAAKKTLQPFKLECADIDWWSVYQVRQRISDHFTVGDRIFLVGDAIHTHSPKVGQGMNVSMQDSYNLGWKICGVIKGFLKPEVLETFETERRPVAQGLIQVDQETVAFYTARGDNVTTQDLTAFRSRHYAFLSGVTIRCMLWNPYPNPHYMDMRQDYNLSRVVAQAADQDISKGIVLGQRMPSYLVINHADTRPFELATMLPSDGKWRLVVFAGDLRDASQMAQLTKSCEQLAAPSSFFRRRRGPDDEMELFDVLTIMSSPRDDTPLLSLPAILRSRGSREVTDYQMVYTDEPDVYGNFADAYGKCGVDRKKGCLVLCRPDQHVAFLGELDSVSKIEQFVADIFTGN